MSQTSVPQHGLLRNPAFVAFLGLIILTPSWFCLGSNQGHAQAAPAKRLYGFMVDPPRTPESLEYYRRLIDFCADWGLNALIFRLTDDQGVAIRFESHPELLTHKNALTPAEVRELAEYAQLHGIELIPEIESFGHSKCITGVKQYADLADQDPRNPDKRSPSFSALIPSHPRVLRLIGDLYREVAAIFPSRYLHGGCDEVAWGGSEFTRRALQTKTRAEVWAQYINSLDELARGVGKEFIIWGDHPLRIDPEILGLLNKDIIIMDWSYAIRDPAAVEEVAGKVLAKGLRVIGGPALTHGQWAPRVGSEQLRNIDAFADAYRRIDNPRCLGVIVTNWLPSRYIQGSIWDGIAYAAVSITEGSAVAREAAFRRFVKRHYAAEWSETWADVFGSYYDITPSYRGTASRSWPKLPVPWRSEEDLISVLKSGSTYVPPFTRILSQLAYCEPLVRKNLSDFRSFRLSLEYLEQLFWRNAVLIEEANRGPTNKESASNLIRTIADRDRRLFDALKEDWDYGRPSDSPSKSQPIYVPESQLVFQFGQAASFSAVLASNPDRFFRLLSETKSTAHLAQ